MYFNKIANQNFDAIQNQIKKFDFISNTSMKFHIKYFNEIINIIFQFHFIYNIFMKF